MTCHFFSDTILMHICISQITQMMCFCVCLFNRPHRWKFSIHDLSPSPSVLCFQGGSAMDHLLHAGHRPHPAGLLLLHRAAAGGGGTSREEPDAATGKQDQAAAEHVAGKDLPLMMGWSLSTLRFGTKQRRCRWWNRWSLPVHVTVSWQFADISDITTVFSLSHFLALLHFFCPICSRHHKLFLRKHFYSLCVTFSCGDEWIKHFYFPVTESPFKSTYSRSRSGLRCAAWAH